MSARVRLDWHGPKVNALAIRAAENGIGKAAEHVLGSARKLVPLEYGTLSASGRATSEGLTAAVSFDTVYAVRQHEEVTWKHYRPGRSAKYLERPLNTEREKVREIVATAIRRALR